jgi:prevent-host-death family protein
MSEIINIYEAKTHLSSLVERAAAGENIVIARAGKPLVRLVPVELDAGKPRESGQLRGLPMPESFFDPLPDEELEPGE